MPAPLYQATCASLPADALAHLAPLRARRDVRVLLHAGRAWVFWPPGTEEVHRRVLSVRGAELFCLRDGTWHQLGQHLPAFGVPSDEEARTLPSLLNPDLVEPEVCVERAWEMVRLTLVRDDQPRPASAVRCSLKELGRWAEHATSRQLEVLAGAISEGVVLLRGERLPPLADGQRFWGQAVLVPLGWRPEPALAQGVLCAALGLLEGEVGVLDEGGVEVVPESAFGALTRAGIRRALREAQS
jgi:hypothetical protein